MTPKAKDQTPPTHLAHSDAYRKGTSSGVGVLGDNKSGLTDMDAGSKERLGGQLQLVPHTR